MECHPHQGLGTLNTWVLGTGTYGPKFQHHQETKSLNLRDNFHIGSVCQDLKSLAIGFHVINLQTKDIVNSVHAKK